MARLTGYLLAVLMLLGAAGPTLAQEATPTAGAGPAWLVIQGFASATLDPDSAVGSYTLTLAGIDPTVLAFTDRPNRLVAYVPAPDFATAVSDAAADPLNATLVAPLSDGTSAMVVVELRSAAHDADAGTVAYGVTLLGAADVDGALAFGAGHLFVDEVQVPVEVPVNVCGNTINVIGLLNPAFGNTCVNA